MNSVRYCVFFLCLAAATLSLAQTQEWLPITPEDLQIKEVPGDPGAFGIQLYYADRIDDETHSEFVYERIKILSEKGEKYADIQIPLIPEASITSLKARTIHSDGSIVDFTGKPFEKTIFKGRGIKFLAKTFTLPDVTVGSIIEYKYKLDYETFSPPKHWVLQRELYTVRESFEFKPSRADVQIAWVVLHAQDAMPTRTHGNHAELEMHNVPAFRGEEYMPPAETLKPSVRFYYLRSNISSTDKYWEVVGKELNALAERFIGDHKEAKEAAAEVIGNESDPEKKLRKLYSRAQQIRNLSYQRQQTAEERKKEDIKTNEDVGEVLKRGYGLHADITRTFVAMARASGFEASVVLTSNRRSDFFIKEALFWRQLDSEIAVVKLNGADVYLDPGTLYCPYGLLRWMRTSVPAMKLDRAGGTFVMIPGAGQEKSVTRRNVVAVLSEDGSLKGEVTVTFQGTEALEHRLDALRTDDAGKTKMLEDELKAWLPSDSIVKLKTAQGWETSDDPLVASFTVETAAYASITGKRLLMPSYLFRAKRKDAFNRADRQYPIYFPYAFSELDVVQIRFPAGFSMENAPEQKDVRLPYARYEDIIQFTGGQLLTKRALLLNGILFPVTKYAELRDFFSKVDAGDEQQAVLHLADSGKGKTGN